MILRPVRPVSARGPPSSKRPVGLARMRTLEVSRLVGSSGSDHVLGQVGQQDVLEVDPGLVLRRDEDGVERHRAVVFVDDAHLGLAVGSQVRELAGPANLGQTL